MLRRSTFCIAVCLIAALAQISVAQDAVKWAPNLSTAVSMASRNNQLVLLHFWAPGCPPCRNLEKNVFNRPEVASAIGRNFVPVKINAQAMPEIATKYKVDRWPMDVVITPAGYPLLSMISPQDPTEYTQALFRVAAQRRPGTQLSSSPQQAIGQAVGAVAAEGRNRFGSATPQDNPYVGVQNSRFARANANNQTPHFQGGGYASQQPNESQQSRFGPSYANNLAPTNDSAQQDLREQQNFRFQPAERQSQPQPQQSVNPYVDARQEANNNGGRFSNDRQQPTVPAEPRENALPPMGLDGYCPVTLIEQSKWILGDKQFGIVHRGRLYLFSSAAEKNRFWQDPDRYAPLLSGYDPVVFADSGRLVPGDRKHGVFFRNQIYLFQSEETLQRFWNAPDHYAGTAQQAMAREKQNVRR